jgi:hypothetical protein
MRWAQRSRVFACLGIAGATGCRGDRVATTDEGARAASISLAEVSDAPLPGADAVDGSVGGHRFAPVASALAVTGDAADARTVVYVLSTPVTCVDASFTGWDERLPEGTEVLSFEVVEAKPARRVSAHYARSSRARSLSWLPATRGRVSLASGEGVEAAVSDRTLSVEFTLWFGADRLAGGFHATRCPTGHEP